MELTATDRNAIAFGDAAYITNKGADLYTREDYAAAVEYYRLAAAMGSVAAISNLGYCHLYARSIEQDTELAIAYFTIAAKKGNPDAAYKLGDIYGGSKWGKEDKEQSLYWYMQAASMLIGTDWRQDNAILWCDELEQYPSLCFALAREMATGGALKTDLSISYKLLKKAEAGYRMALANGFRPYAKSLEDVLALMADPQFEIVRAQIDEEFDE